MIFQYVSASILEGLEAHLNVNGHVIIIGEAIGDENGPILFDHLKKYLPKGYACKLILQMRTSKEQYIERKKYFKNVMLALQNIQMVIQ